MFIRFHHSPTPGLSNSITIKTAFTELMEKEGRSFYEKVRPLLGSGATWAMLDCAPHMCCGQVPAPVLSVKHKGGCQTQGAAQNPNPVCPSAHSCQHEWPCWWLGQSQDSCTGLWLVCQCNCCLSSSSNTVFASLQAPCKDTVLILLSAACH